MDKEMNAPELLEILPQPGFCVTDNQIQYANQAAGALMLAPGDDILPLLVTGQEDYAGFQTGQLYLSLSIGGICRSACVTRIGTMDLFLLDPEAAAEEFRSMGLVSMELRQPLNRAITGVQHLLSERDTLTPGAEARAAQLNQSLMQLMRLACNLSDIGRYRASSRMETRDICSFLEELLEKAQTLTGGTGIRIEKEIPREILFCLMDPEQMERAVWNLISNAIKFTPKGGSILCRLRRLGNRIQLTVQDSGSGIADSIRLSLFHRYQRQPGIEDSRFGLGLGMSIVQTAAMNHGGVVLVDKAEDSGTRITITFPIRTNTDSQLCSPIFRPDYSGGWDHGLMELADCLPSDLYGEL